MDFRHLPPPSPALPASPVERAPAASDPPLLLPPASDQPNFDPATLNLDRPGKPSNSPPLSHAPLPPSMDLNLERPPVRAPASPHTTPTEVFDLTGSSSPGKIILDRPHHKASAGTSSATPPAPMNLERPLRKAKSGQSHAGLAPSDKSSLSAGRGTHPSVKGEVAEEDWAEEKLAFPRSKVGNPCRLIFGG